MAAGALDRRVQVLRETGGDDGFSSTAGRYATFGVPVWAAKRDVNDTERWRADQVAASVTTRFTVRWSGFARGITPRDRLICDGVTYEITGIKEGSGRRRWLEITCAARSDERASDEQ
ncbi:head-tail adaptor protein [Mesobaculum littorinae]|uniref:Head-tail adaptor protein n=1 Tax=Mesobaculum littorinae TaxID=2486419 RepID=A0A438AM77_9RHOB|nr:phage head closure protein [Mesobaculum littorinae]RVV99705.1 head-tail adaptor protein [Mesobaculum littorinae]